MSKWINIYGETFLYRIINPNCVNFQRTLFYKESTFKLFGIFPLIKEEKLFYAPFSIENPQYSKETIRTSLEGIYLEWRKLEERKLEIKRGEII